jgi:tRNA threonylcarbamoyladenosine biosynthesis protein TsaB
MAGQSAMKILAIRTDKPKAELYIYDDGEKLAHIEWQAHLQLAETLNTKIEEILNKSSISYVDLDGIAIFKGPGSFTGLRIGMSVANALAYSQRIPIFAAAGENWLQQATRSLKNGEDNKTVVPEYGSEARITKPKK